MINKKDLKQIQIYLKLIKEIKFNKEIIIIADHT